MTYCQDNSDFASLINNTTESLLDEKLLIWLCKIMRKTSLIDRVQRYCGEGTGVWSRHTCTSHEPVSNQTTSSFITASHLDDVLCVIAGDELPFVHIRIV